MTDTDERTVTGPGAPTKNSLLHQAKRAKNDEFYTQWVDIQREMNAYIEYDPDVFRGKTILLPCDDPDWSNFTRFFALHFVDLGIAKLISTSYAPARKPAEMVTPPSELEARSPQFDPELSHQRGKVFTLTPEDITGDGRIDLDDLRFEYLEGDGDFRSDEVTALRDEADIVINNPPFSLFREFLAWLIGGGVQFSIVGNQNAITYKEIFPLIRDDKMWLGKGFPRNMAHFRTPYKVYSQWVEQEGDDIVRVPGVQWFTNIEHGRRHEPLKLMTMADNQRYSKHKQIRESGYPKYDNYDAIEVSNVDAIPSDHRGVMGVPITFMTKYNPAQFEIVGASESEGKGFSAGLWDSNSGVAQPLVDGAKTYKRILIRHRNPARAA